MVIEKRTTPTVVKIGKGVLKEIKLASFILLRGELYFRGPNNLLARCIGRQETTYNQFMRSLAEMETLAYTDACKDEVTTGQRWKKKAPTCRGNAKNANPIPRKKKLFS